jgi:hypothetical protein
MKPSGRLFMPKPAVHWPKMAFSSNDKDALTGRAAFHLDFVIPSIVGSQYKDQFASG